MEDKGPIFREITINGVRFKNRILRSSMGGRTSYYDGKVTPAWKNFELRFARHGIAGIISATIDVDDNRLSPLEYPKITDSTLSEALRGGVKAVQALDCRYIMQLGDPGGHTQTSLFPQKEDGESASSYFDLLYGYRNRTSAMTVQQIKDEVGKFRDAAGRVKRIGCDGLEITASKGYIIHQFLNPATNRRTDTYGGSVDNRFRLLREIVQEVRNEVGRDFLFGVRLSAQDYNYLPLNIRLPPVWPPRHYFMGNTLKETLHYGKELKALGVDYLHIDSGFGFIGPKGNPGKYPLESIRLFANATRHLSAKAWLRAAFVNALPTPIARAVLGFGWKYVPPDARFAAHFKKEVGLHVIANGGFQYRDTMEDALRDHVVTRDGIEKNVPKCDMIAIARPLLANPDLLEQFDKDPQKNSPDNPCSWCNHCCSRTAVLPLGCYDVGRFKRFANPQKEMEAEILRWSADSTP